MSKKERVTVSDVDFVTFAVSARSYEELAAATGMTVGSCRIKHKKFRDAGVNLPKYDRQTRQGPNVVALNALISLHKNPLATGEQT